MKPSRFRRPWRMTDIPGGFRVDDATGQPLGYFYYWDAPKAAHQIALTRGEASLMAETFSQMPLAADGPGLVGDDRAREGAE